MLRVQNVVGSGMQAARREATAECCACLQQIAVWQGVLQAAVVPVMGV